jgi:hypothetical protein
MEDLLHGVHELTHACFMPSSFPTGGWIRRPRLFSGRRQDPANAPSSTLHSTKRSLKVQIRFFIYSSL